jgi:transcriptional regulator with XRE-family HTH domain
MGKDNAGSLGEFLRQERERRGITIEQVASATKISVRLLHSLEADHFVDLPAKPFIRGFVSSYARFINVDPQEILTRFGDFIEEKVQERPRRDAGHSGYAFERREGEQSRTMLWVIMASFVVLGGVLIFILKPALHHHKQNSVDKLRAVHPAVPSASPSVAVSPGPVVVLPAVLAQPSPVVASPSPSPSPSPAPLPSPLPSTKPDPLNSGADIAGIIVKVKYKVVFKALGDVWVRYKVDEKPIMRIILRKDRVLVLRAQSRLRFQVSNPKLIVFSATDGRGTKLEANDKTMALRQGNATLTFPTQDIEKIQEPFPGQSPLPAVPPPPPRAAPSPVANPE